MNDEIRLKIRRVSAWCGPAWLVLVGLGWAATAGFFPPWRPTMDATELAAAYQADAIRIRLGMLILMFGALALVPYVATVTEHIKRFEGSFGILSQSTLMGGLCIALFMFFAALWWMVLVFRPHTPDVTQIFSDMAWMTFLGAGTLSAPFIAVPAIMAFLDKSPDPVFPRWFGWLTVWTGLGAGAIELLFMFSRGIIAWNGLLAFYIPAAIFVAWVIAFNYLVVKDAKTRCQAPEKDDLVLQP